MIQVKKRGKEPLRPIIDVALNYPLRLALFPAGDDRSRKECLPRCKESKARMRHAMPDDKPDVLRLYYFRLGSLKERSEQWVDVGRRCTQIFRHSEWLLIGMWKD